MSDILLKILSMMLPIVVPILLFAISVGILLRRWDKIGEEQKDQTKKPSAIFLRLGKEVIYVASVIHDEKEFQSRALLVRNRLAFEQASRLTMLFHNPPKEPENFNKLNSSGVVFGVWMSACQDAILEILYNYKSKAIPLLTKIGFGKYDWTQYKAIHILCRLALMDIQKNEFCQKINENIDSFRWEAQMNVLSSLSLIEGNQHIDDIYRRFYLQSFDHVDFEELNTIIENWCVHYGHSVALYHEDIFALMKNKTGDDKNVSELTFYLLYLICLNLLASGFDKTRMNPFIKNLSSKITNPSFLKSIKKKENTFIESAD